MIQRPYWKQRLESAWRTRPIVWLSGVRRVGKTVLSKSIPDAVYLNWDLLSTVRRLEDPESFYRALPPGSTVVLDEVHRLPDPSRVLKIASDAFPTLRILATGSSTLAATGKFRDSLTGRKWSVYLCPVLWDECLGGFGGPDLDHRLLLGGLPELLLAPDPIPGYQAYPEAYDVSADRDLVGTAEFWMCVVEPLPEVVDFFDLVIGHDLGDGEAELLTPPLYQDFNGQVIDCANAAFQHVVVGSAGAPGWLQLAGMILEPVVNRILDVEPLNAMYFAGTGLGGRGGSLSSFAPVDSGYDSFFLDFDVTGLGQLEIDGSAVCGNEPDAGFCSRVPYPPDTNVLITAVSYPGYVFDSWVGCDNPDGLQCEMTMDADKLVEATFVVASGPVLTVTIPGRTEVTASNGEALFFTCDGGLEGNTCQAVFGAEDNVTLTTTVWVELQARLWSGVICSEGSNNQSTCTFSMVGDQNVVLQFDTPV